MSITFLRERFFSKMLKFLNDCLKNLKPCFTRTRTFEWFVIIILGFIIRPDVLGLTSIVRAFGFGSLAYNSVRHFFRSSAYDPKELLLKWCSVVAEKAPVFKINGRSILIGDGIKRSTEGKFMPCEKPLRSDSQNNGKRSFFIGHFYGSICVLAKSCSTILGIPLFFSVQEGDRALYEWQNKPYFCHKERILLDALSAARSFGKSYLVLDRFFLSRNFIKFWLDQKDNDLLDLIMRAKTNIVAYTDPVIPPKGRRGRKPKRGERIKLNDLFKSPELFKTKNLKIYGKTKKVNYYCRDLIWGQGLYKKLRFVLAVYDKKHIILVSTDLKVKAEDIILAYSYRFKIELTFKDFKHIFGGLYNHFWTKAVEKITKWTNVYKSLMGIKDPKEQEKVLKTVKANNAFVACCVISMGLVQLLCLNYPNLTTLNLPYQRTKRRDILTERQMSDYLRLNLLAFGFQEPDLTVSQILISYRQSYFIS